MYLNVLDSLSKKDQEISLLKDRTFNLQYVSVFCNHTNAYMLTAPFRNQLIQTLTSMTSPTASFLNSSGTNFGLVAPKPDLIPLRHSDYPKVKHWVRKRGDNSQVSVIKVVDADSMSDDDESLGDDDLNQEDGVLAFLEKDDGKLISYDDKKQLYRAMRGFWNDRIDGRNPPLNWSSAGETLRNAFRDFLESKFFYLRLCTGRWKVEELWKRNYHSWLRSFECRTTNASSRRQKRKHTEETTSNARTTTQTKKARMKARAISVDSDDPDTNKTYCDEAIDSGDATNTINDGLFDELDEVLHFFLTPIYHFRHLVDEIKCRYSKRESSRCVSCVQIP